MSLKSFSFGLGLGLAFVSMLFLVLLKVEVDKVKAEKQSVLIEMSDEDIINRAKELGMVLYTDLPSKKDVQEENISAEEIDTAEQILEEDTELNIINKKTDDVNNDSEMIAFSIVSGSTAGKISLDLQEIGLIDDADDFKKYLIEKGYTTKIATGNYEIAQGSDYDEIIEVIKEKKLY